jgi:hypothetical protein
MRTFLGEKLAPYYNNNSVTYKHDPEGMVTNVHFNTFSYFFAIEVCVILIDTG